MMTMQLTPAQKTHLREHGFVQLPGIVPRRLIDGALRSVNIALSGGSTELCSGDPDPTGISKAVDALQGTPPINDLVLRSPLKAVAEDLLGEVNWHVKPKGWLVLRYPRPDTDPPKRPNYHIDGIYSRDEAFPDEAYGRIPQGEINSSSMKAMVYLSDVPSPDSGNFTVVPGSHLAMAKHLKKVGWEVLRKGCPKIPLGEPRQILGRAGDAVICHYLLLHDGEKNRSPHIRYAAFFNLSQARHHAQWRESLCDPFLEWPGLADAAAKSRSAKPRS